MARLPSMSVVTATYNRGALVEQAIDNVLSQDYPGVLEHIVIDGASTDDTLARLSRYPHLRVVSEPDEGVYDAWNKGIRRATGQVVGILNSDDLFAPGALKAVGEVIAERGTLDMVVGRAIVFADLPNERRELLEMSEQPSPLFGIETFNWVTPIINARFFDRRVFERIGLFDTRYEVESDIDFMLRLALAQATSAYLDRVIIEYRSHRGSLTMGRYGDPDIYSRERLAILEHHLGNRSLDRRARRILRRLHTWQCCTAIASLLRPRVRLSSMRFVGARVRSRPLVRPQDDPVRIVAPPTCKRMAGDRKARRVDLG